MGEFGLELLHFFTEVGLHARLAAVEGFCGAAVLFAEEMDFLLELGYCYLELGDLLFVLALSALGVPFY